MSTNPQSLNFDDLGAKPVPASPASGSLDFSDLGAKRVSTSDTNGTSQPASQPEETGVYAGVKRGVSALVNLPGAVYHAAVDSPRNEKRN